MRIELKVRVFARRFLPSYLRKAIGHFAGLLKSHVVYPLCGFLFDVSGGTYKLNGCDFFIPKNITSRQFRASFFLKDYEMEEISLVKEYVKNSDSVLEVGACMGILSCITSKKINKKNKHVVVEANPKLIDIINLNKKKNCCNFDVYNLALSNSKNVEFYINRTHVTGSSTRQLSDEKVVVPGISLYDLFYKYGPFTVLIMDIEGSEVDILSSPFDLIGLKTIIIEIHDQIIGEDGVEICRKSLTNSGFSLIKKMHLSELWVKNN